MASFSERLSAIDATAASAPPPEREALDQRGYLVLEGLLDRSSLARLSEVFEEACGSSAGSGKASGTRHAEDLRERAAELEEVLTHPRVLSGVDHILGEPFEVLVFGARDPLPGYGLQGLHTDWMPRQPKEPYAVATALWLLDDFTELNGATRVVPGSHLIPGMLPKNLRAPESVHPKQELVRAPAGAALLFNGHLVHGGTRNDSKSSRRVFQIQYVLRKLRRPGSACGQASEDLSELGRLLLGSTL